MKREKTFARIASLLCALVLALGTSIPAFAADGGAPSAQPTGSITVTSDDNSVSTLYKIISISDFTEGSTNAPLYTWDANVAQWLKDNGHASFVGDGNVVTPAFNIADAGEGAGGNPSLTDDKNAAAQFFGELSAAIANGQIKLDPSATLENGKTAENLALGSYLIATANKDGAATDNIRIYNTTVKTLGPTENEQHQWTLGAQPMPVDVTVKSSIPSISKTQSADGKNPADASTIGIGKQVTYTLTATVPSYPASMAAADKVFTITDTMSKGLSFNASSVSIKAGATDLTNLFTVTPKGDSSHGTTTTIAPTNGYDAISAYANQTVTITYTATVTADAVVSDPMTNSATLTYGHDYTTTSKEVKVYTFGLDLLKYNKSDNSKAPLAGAEFSLSSNENGSNPISFVPVDEANGVYRVAIDGEAGTTTLKATTGTLSISGLDAGTYYVSETKAPDGFQRMQGTQKVTVTAAQGADGNPNGSVTETNPNNHTGFSYVEISNTTGFSLPQTGGIGGLLMTAAAVLLIGGGIAIALGKRNRKNGER